jgi:ferredoxin--NADP+ reductase
MGIPGEDLRGSHTATEFVGWYNGHPDFRDRIFDLKQECVAIIGQGNVAADVCRLLTRPVDELRTSDIAEHALDALAESRIREIHIIGRRGPAQAKFTTKELRELTALTGVVATVDGGQLELSEACEAELSSHLSATAQKNVEVFRAAAANLPTNAEKRIHFRFFASPVAVIGDSAVQAIRLGHNRLSGEPFAQTAQSNGIEEDLPCGLIFRSIGYKGTAIPQLPFDEHQGVVPNQLGRVVADDGPVSGLYVTGWIKRGANGIIGTNRADSLQTVESVFQDLGTLTTRPADGRSSVMKIINERGKRIVGIDDWFGIDAAEIQRGIEKGKPREKFTRVEDMLTVLG